VPGPASILLVTPWATEPAVVDAPDDPAAVRAGLEPATPRVPETGGRAREQHEGHDCFDLSHARRPSLRAAAFAVYLTRMRMAGGPESELPAQLVPSVEEFQEKREKLNADQGGRLTLEKGDAPEGSQEGPRGRVGVNRRLRFPCRREEGSLSCSLEGTQGHRGRRAKGRQPPGRLGSRKRGRSRNAE
jgi:hypothetical protein